MSFDTSRIRFDPWKNYDGIVMLQGRVQLDSDWNEWLAELSRRTRAGTLDLMGRAAYPATTPFAFRIDFDPSGHLQIGPGRMYVDGMLAENHGDPATAVWDPALGELSNTPQPAPTVETGAIPFAGQPYLPTPPTVPTSGTFVAYLDVWTRAVTHLQDPTLIDAAVGVDTTGRLQTVWQVKLAATSAGTTCATAGAPWPAASVGRLTTAPLVSTPSGPCCLTDNTGFTGMENQHYRVEIHVPGAVGTATFKWSRDNASIETGVSDIRSVTNSVGATASQLTVFSMGRDQVLGFHPGDWIEVLDDALELAGEHGELHRIDTIDFSARAITLDASVSAFPTATLAQRHTRIRRWDQVGKVYESDGTTVFADLGAAGSSGDIPVPPAGTTLILENGITVAFDVASPTSGFNVGDFWTFAARAADGTVEKLDGAPPRGIHHHYTALSVVDFAAGTATDCRTPWSPGGDESCGCCCTVTVGDGVESVGAYTSIQAAIDALPDAGGEVCILPGRYFEHVFIERRHDVVIRGCGYQTRLASPSYQPLPPPPAPRIEGAAPVTAAASKGPFDAVISIASSRHIRLLDFAVEADADEVGILLDGSGALVSERPATAKPAQPAEAFVGAAEFVTRAGVVDVTIAQIFLTASTRPAILAKGVRQLRIDDNRIAMEDVPSLWPAVYVSGREIHVDRNDVGIQSVVTMREWFPDTVVSDLAAASLDGAKAAATGIALHQGGIQIAGPSQGVMVVENRIVGGRFNGVTLGSYDILDANGGVTATTVGIRITHEDPCSTTGTLQPPGIDQTPGGGTVVAGGPLVDIHIDRNRISRMGLCGIGPIGFFDLAEILEVISIENLFIIANDIRDTLLRPTAILHAFGGASFGTAAAPGTSAIGSADTASAIPYGAICVPSVENLVIRDNAVTDFGARPGVRASGIFVLHGEMVEISRNQIRETRDWSAESADGVANAGGLHGGILLAVVTPPSIAQTQLLDAFSKTIYEPGLPALRVEENVVRVPLGLAFAAIGFGPFAVSDNHFTCGGTVRGSGFPIAQTVLILNLGTAIEAVAISKPSGLYTGGLAGYSKLEQKSPAALLATSSNGSVVFTDNICQLEVRADRQRSVSSVFILSMDSLVFANNQCWFDAASLDAFMDVLLLAGTLNATGNRMQESGASVLISGLTFGVVNITAQNISTFCLIVKGAMMIDQSNLALIDAVQPELCAALKRQ